MYVYNVPHIQTSNAKFPYNMHSCSRCMGHWKKEKERREKRREKRRKIEGKLKEKRRKKRTHSRVENETEKLQAK